MNTDGRRRRRNADETRELLLQTFAQMVVEKGPTEVSMQQFADRVGVTHRTIYRYFASRQELIDQMAEWLDEHQARRGAMSMPASAGDLPGAIRSNYRLFDEDEALVTALVLMTWGIRSPSRVQRQRTRAFTEALEAETAHLDPTQARALSALVRYIASSRTWLALREDFGLSGEESGPTVAWVIETLLAALRDPENPGPGGAKEGLDQ